MTKISTLGGVLKVKKPDGTIPIWDARKAVGFWRAKDYSGAGVIPDLSDNGHDMTNFGAKFLPFDGEKYFYNPGVDNNSISSPDDAVFDLTDDFEIEIDAEMPSWATGGFQSLYGKVAAPSQFGHLVTLTSGGLFALYASVTGGVSTSVGVAHGFANNSRHVLKVTRRKSDGVTKFFDHVAGVWTQIGVDQILYAGQSLFNSNSPVHIAGRGDISGQRANGKIYSIKIRNAIDGPIVASWSAEDMGQTGGVSGGKTWTINRAATGLKSVLVDRPLFLLGTDDYMETPDHADFNFGVNDSFTIVTVLRQFETSALNGRIIAKGPYTTASWILYSNGNSMNRSIYLSDGTNTGSFDTLTLTAGEVHNLAAVRNVVTDIVRIVLDGISGVGGVDILTDPITNTYAVAIGADSGGGTSSDMEFMGAAIFRRALSDEEIVEVGETLGAG